MSNLADLSFLSISISNFESSSFPHLLATLSPVGTYGKLGGQAHVPNVEGTWKDLTENVNKMADNLTSQVREIARVTKCVAEGVLTEFITVDVKGEILDLKMTVNNMVRQLKTLSDEIIRVSVEVGTEGRLGGQANVDDVKGQWQVSTQDRMRRVIV